jgi:inner membrane protein
MIGSLMPSPIGHLLAGVAAAWGADLVPGDRGWRTAPSSAGWWARAGNGLTLTCAALAASPDLDLLVGGHRTVTHSVTAAAVVGIAAAAIARGRSRHVSRIALMCAAAYATHLALDLMAVDRARPYGIQALWPFSHEWFITGWDVFAGTERRQPLSIVGLTRNVRAVAQEIAILTPILIALWLVRVKALARLSTELPGRDHPTQ